MKKTLVGMLAVAAMLSFTLSAQAVPQLDRASQSMPMVHENASGQAPNAGSIDDDCTSGGFALGTLTPFMTIPADTTGLVNDFTCDAVCGAPCNGGCAYYGGSAPDGVAVFQVPTTGTWRFSSCGGAIVDSSLAVREGGACPGASCVAQDDDSCAGCAAPYEARLTVALTAGQDYYLIVDGFGAGSFGNIDMLVTGPCTVAADCNDGIFCNGTEVCNAGTCAAGTNPCSGNTPLCDEGTDSCSGCASDPSQCVDNSLFCDGVGACLPTGSCGQSGNPCTAIQTCNETTNACDDPATCTSWDVRGTPGGGSISPQSFNACLDRGQFDDIQLSGHTSRNLISYRSSCAGRDLDTNPACTHGANPGICPPYNLGDPYTAHMSLWTVTSGGGCLPDTQIAGSLCSRTTDDSAVALVADPGGTPGHFITCDGAAGLASGIVLPDGDDDPVTGQCGVDVYIELFFTGPAGPGGSFQIDNAPGFPNKVIGGPAMDDDFLQAVFVTPDCDINTGMALGTYAFGAFGSGFESNFRRTSFCTEPAGPCCDGAGGCDQLTATECTDAGGTYLGDNELGTPNTCDSPDGDGDMVRDECDGCPADGTKVVPGQCGCGNPDTDTDGDGTADCNDGCPMDPGKIAPGVCGCGNPDTDSDGDGTADCQDQCPNDPNKVTPGICGCGVAETGDSDGDGVSDCVDQCPGVDDAVFFPGCQGAIPTVSEWGMVVLALLLLAGAKVYFGRRTVQA